MWKHHRIMDLISVAVLLSGCILSASGMGLKKRSVDVQNIFNHFDDLLMVKSSVPTESHHVCVKSVDELNEIENAFVRTEGQVPNTRDTDVAISITFSPNCSKVSKLKTEILKLKNHFAEMIAMPVCSFRYRTLKASLEAKISQFKSFMDSVKAKETGERLNMVVKLETDFETQRKLIVEILTKLEAEQKQMNDAKVQVVIERLQQGKYEEAATAMGLVTDSEKHIERVVTSVYGNGENFEKICRFVAGLPLHGQLNGYKVLREQLKKDDKMRDQHIWALAGEINGMQARDRGELEAVMVDFKAMVRNNNLDGLVAILNKDGGVESMTDFVPFLVRTIYEEADKSGVEKFFTVLNRMSIAHLKLYMINEFILMLKSTGGMHGKDMSLIIFELIKLRSDKGPQNKPWIQVIEMNLPAELRDLMYDHLCIRNGLNHEYLFVGAPVDAAQRHVHTARKQLNDSASWRVHFIDNGKKIQIKNSKFNESVYLIEEGSHDDEHVLRISMTAKPEGDKTVEFYLDMLGDGEFLIVNEYFGQVLYSPFNSEPSQGDNRPVFSKKFDRNNIEADSKWIIGVCRVDVEYKF